MIRRFLTATLALLFLTSHVAASDWLINSYRFGAAALPSLAIATTATYSQDTITNSHPITLPSGIQAGELLLVVLSCNSPTSMTDPAGWTVVISNTGVDYSRVYAKIATGSEGSSVTVTLGSNERAAAISYRITGNRNAVTTSEIAVSSNNDSTTSNPDPPSLTPSWGSAENLWFAINFSAFGGNTVSAYPAGYTLDQQLSQTPTTTAGSGVAVAVKLATATTDDPGQFTYGTSRSMRSYTLAIRPQ